MSAAARLLRRRSSLLLQQRHKIYSSSFSFLGIPVQPLRPVPTAVFGHRKLTASATSKPPQSTNTGTSTFSGSKALRYTTAGAAILLFSSAAWSTTRTKNSPEVQQIGLPQNFNGEHQDEKSAVPGDEKPVNYGQSGQAHEGRKEEAVREGEEVIPLEQERPDDGQEVRGFADDVLVVKEAVENGEGPLTSTSPEPQDDVRELDSESQERGVSSHTSLRESSMTLNETEEDEVHPSEEPKGEVQNELESFADAVKEKVSNVKEFLFTDGSDVSEEKDGGNDESEGETFRIRGKLREEFPEMFYSGSVDDEGDGVHEEANENAAGTPKFVEILEGGSHGYVGAHSVPSRLSASYLVQRGHEASVRRYSEKGQEGNVKDVLETDKTIREQLEKGDLSEELKIGQEKPRVVGVDVLVGAIDTAKQLQAEVDGRTFQDQFLKIQEAHQRELKDFQDRLSSYAEGTDQLEKELRKEKEEAAAALKRQEEDAENRLQSELERKEREAAEEKERLQMLEKAQAAASLTREKADHLEEIHSVQLQVDALRTAFYTRSEEARISHTAHKLAMGAFALEDAVKRGTPFDKEADLLISSAGGPGVDPLVDAIVSSLPDEGLVLGTGTRAHLHQKFAMLKGALRELSLMPPGGGGVFAHFFARLTANLKIREQGSDAVGSEGIEVVIGKVESLLADEDLVEAAAVIESGARGTAAEGLAAEWAKQARNQAIIEQGLQALRAHVVTVASGLS